MRRVAKQPQGLNTFTSSSWLVPLNFSGRLQAARSRQNLRIRQAMLFFIEQAIWTASV